MLLAHKFLLISSIQLSAWRFAVVHGFYVRRCGVVQKSRGIDKIY